jgi:hypothetical protein
MRLNSKVAVLVAGAVLVLAASVATAYALNTQSVALQVGGEQGTGFSGSYGDEIVLQPASMTSIELPGDKFHFQAYVSNVTSMGVSVGMQWTDFRDFEDIQLEDTNTVLPFAYNLGVDDAVILGDGTVVYPTPPYLIRAEYKPAGSSTTPTASFSETETVSVEKNNSTKVTISKSGVVRHNGTWFNFQVSPNCGPGTIVVTVKKSGAKNRTYNVFTNEDGVATAKLKLGTKNGTYKVYAKFLGNVYGVASATAVKTFRASH